jgi:hypothetical protein
MTARFKLSIALQINPSICFRKPATRLTVAKINLAIRGLPFFQTKKMKIWKMIMMKEIALISKVNLNTLAHHTIPVSLLVMSDLLLNQLLILHLLKLLLLEMKKCIRLIQPLLLFPPLMYKWTKRHMNCRALIIVFHQKNQVPIHSLLFLPLAIPLRNLL